MVPASSAVALPFELVPFPGDPVPAGLRLHGQIRRQGDSLELLYRLIGPWRELRIPAAAPTPERRDGLWQSTCLECFLAHPGDRAYWELNVCPSGHWNGYLLPAYRGELGLENGFSAPQLQLLPGDDQLEARIRLALPPEAAAAVRLEVAVTAVLETLAGAVSHWALAHPGTAADFHRRDTFLLRV